MYIYQAPRGHPAPAHRARSVPARHSPPSLSPLDGRPAESLA